MFVMLAAVALVDDHEMTDDDPWPTAAGLAEMVHAGTGVGATTTGATYVE
jgi:hypothetical protein